MIDYRRKSYTTSLEWITISGAGGNGKSSTVLHNENTYYRCRYWQCYYAIQGNELDDDDADHDQRKHNWLKEILRTVNTDIRQQGNSENITYSRCKSYAVELIVYPSTNKRWGNAKILDFMKKEKKFVL